MKRTALIVLAFTSTLIGCEQTNQTTEQIKELSKQVESLLPVVQTGADKSLNELKKLRQIQYRLVSLPAHASDKAIEQKLNAMGDDGWDCVTSGIPSDSSSPDLPHQESSPPILRFFCKRPVETPLRYLPKTLLGNGN